MVREKPISWIPLNLISDHVKNAIIVSEDWAFYQHSGYDVSQIKEALLEFFRGERVRGASTITQQVAKNVFLSNERTLMRKFKEAILAFKIERDLSKAKILETYLNIVEFGPGVYGIGNASAHYFQVPASALRPKEAAFLAMLLPSPVRYSASYRKRELTKFAKSTMQSILKKMVQARYLTAEASTEAWQQPLVFENSFEELDDYTPENEALDETGPEEEESEEYPGVGFKISPAENSEVNSDNSTETNSDADQEEISEQP